MIDELLIEGEILNGTPESIITARTDRTTIIKSWVSRSDRDVKVQAIATGGVVDFMKRMMKSDEGDVSGQIHTSDLLKIGGQSARVVEFSAENQTRLRPGFIKPTKKGSSSQSKYRGYFTEYHGHITSIYCTCDDFFYRIHEPMYRRGLVLDHHPDNLGRDHTYAKAILNATNSDGLVLLCKHLYAAIKEL